MQDNKLFEETEVKLLRSLARILTLGAVGGRRKRSNRSFTPYDQRGYTRTPTVGESNSSVSGRSTRRSRDRTRIPTQQEIDAMIDRNGNGRVGDGEIWEQDAVKKPDDEFPKLMGSNNGEKTRTKKPRKIKNPKARAQGAKPIDPKLVSEDSERDIWGDNVVKKN